MDLRRLRAADWGAGFFGAALIGLLWAPWFRGWHTTVSVHTPLQRALAVRFEGVNAWQSMAVNDVLLLVAGLLGLWLLVATAFYSTAAVPLAASVFAALGGIVASLLAMVELIWPPSPDVGSSFPTAAAGLATASAVGLALCSLVSMSGERRTLPSASPIPMTPAPPVAS